MSFTRDKDRYPMMDGSWLDSYALRLMGKEARTPDEEASDVAYYGGILRSPQSSMEQKMIAKQELESLKKEYEDQGYPIPVSISSTLQEFANLGSPERSVNELADEAESRLDALSQQIPRQQQTPESPVAPESPAPQEEASEEAEQEVKQETKNMLREFSAKLSEVEKLQNDLIGSYGNNAVDQMTIQNIKTLRTQIDYLLGKQRDQYNKMASLLFDEELKTAQVKQWLDPRNWFNPARRQQQQQNVDPSQIAGFQEAVESGKNQLNQKLSDLYGLSEKINSRFVELLARPEISENRKKFLREQVGGTIGMISNVLQGYSGSDSSSGGMEGFFDAPQAQPQQANESIAPQGVAPMGAMPIQPQQQPVVQPQQPQPTPEVSQPASSESGDNISIPKTDIQQALTGIKDVYNYLSIDDQFANIRAKLEPAIKILEPQPTQATASYEISLIK